MRLLITGAGGQLGTDLASHARAAGDDIVAMTKRDLDLAAGADQAAMLQPATSAI